MEEYNETKAETLDQLREFQAFLERSLRGDMTLVTNNERHNTQRRQPRLCALGAGLTEHLLAVVSLCVAGE